MSHPKYLPGMWIQYKSGRSEIIAKILGAHWDERHGWIYYVTNPMEQNKAHTASEDAVLRQVAEYIQKDKA